MNKYTKEMAMFIDETISFHSDRNGFVDVDKLPCSAIKEFAAICMETSDDELVFITESDQSELTKLMIQHFKKEDDDTLFDLDEYISHEAVKYYMPILEEMLESVSSHNMQTILESNGFHMITDRGNGENNWINGSRRVNS